jgi:hypothetical protein
LCCILQLLVISCLLPSNITQLIISVQPKILSAYYRLQDIHWW